MNHHRPNYLCQVNTTVSCGACCGLYNLPDLSRGKLEQLLSKRTEDFSSVPRTEEDIFTFQRKNRGPDRLSRPFPQFHHCPFLGLIGSARSRVGCLLHPAAPGNNNCDFRSLSWYGELACRSYFCPSTEKLPSSYKAVLTEVVDHWYDFGLIVTEHQLVISYFKELEARLGRDLTADDFTQNPLAKEALADFIYLKSSWPYRREDVPGPCNYFFDNNTYTRPEVFRAEFGIPQSQFEAIYKELDSGFSSEKELEEADTILEKLFAKVLNALHP